MTPERAARLLEAGRAWGADFVELFVEESRFSNVSLRDRKVESASTGTEFGIGVRLLWGTQVVYGHTSRDDDAVLENLVRELARSRSTAFARPGAPLVLSLDQVATLHPVRLRPSQVGQDRKLPLLRQVDETARSVSSWVAQVSASALDRETQVQIFNSEGLAVQDRRSWSRLTISVVAERHGERHTGSESPGRRQGFEFFEELDVENRARVAAERAVRMLDAGYVEAGEMPVILGNGFGGVIFHEACGHPLETESVRRNASTFAGRVGELVAHPAVTAIDDGTIPGAWGSIDVDDEGMPTRKTVLIENGILKQYLSDRVGAQECNVDRTGSARRESYKYAPVSRMRNTYIDAGTSTLDDMLAQAGNGLYASRMGGGSVNPATGEFNFAVEEGYLVRGGRIGPAVRGATLIGKGHEILPRISMVGSDLEFAAGTCGAASGSVPVCVGQPSLLVDRILVGGRS